MSSRPAPLGRQLLVLMALVGLAGSMTAPRLPAWSAVARNGANRAAAASGLATRADAAVTGSRVRQREPVNANPGQPTIAPGATGGAVRRLQRALRRTPNPGLQVDGVFGPETEHAVIQFQSGNGLTADAVVGPRTWAALPDGAPMPTLERGSTGEVVRRLQQVLTNGAPGQWGVGPGGVDGIFGAETEASVKAFQRWGGVTADGVVGDQTWAVSLHAASATLETAVGLQFVID
jgi:peptidoglycan hydrolase-like protein with peptidoglycan-binding domain